jgi:hypothetical protein
LSDEENELEDIVRFLVLTWKMRKLILCFSLQNMQIHNRGFKFLIPIGRVLTQQEEKTTRVPVSLLDVYLM